jgi:hypothetical protein
MAQQRAGYALTLKLIDHDESYLGRPRPYYDVTSAARDKIALDLVHHCYERNLIDKIDVHECRDLLLAEGASHTEEAAVE